MKTKHYENNRWYAPRSFDILYGKMQFWISNTPAMQGGVYKDNGRHYAWKYGKMEIFLVK